MEFKMDPPRNRSDRHAVAIISSVTDKAFIVEKMEFIEPNDVDNAVQVFRKLRRLSMKVEPDSTQKMSRRLAIPHTPDSSESKRCRTLASVPTDESLEDPTLNRS